MSQPEPIPPDPELTAIEAALGSLSPKKSRLDRDRLMFLAGQTRRKPTDPGRWPWPAIAAGLALVALGEAAWLALRPLPEPRIVERVVVVHEPAPVDSEIPKEPEGPAPVVILSQSPGSSGRPASFESAWPSAPAYMQLRRDVLRYGVEGLPEPPPLAMLSNGEVPEPSRRPLRAELESLLNPGESS